jgi:hypothetical protein
MMMPRIEELGRSGRMVASPKQEAVLIVDGNAVRVILRTHFRGGPEELAWVVPVPARPTDIKPGDDSLFTLLEEETAPRFVRVLPSKGHGFVCGCATWVYEGGEPLAPPVRVVEVGKAGIFDYAVLSSRDANELSRWLRENKYAIPDGAAAVFDSYVRQGWHWLAMRVRAEAGSQLDRAPHPITYTYRSERLVYPLAISRLSADVENEIVLYVAADERFASTNWSNVAPGSLEVRPEANAASGTNYASLLRAETRLQSGRLFVTEFSRTIASVPALCEPNGVPKTIVGPPVRRDTGTGRVLTRLRAVAPREALDRDVLLAPYAEGHWIGSPEAVPVRNEIRVSAGGADPSGAQLAAPLAPLALAGLSVGLVRRRGWRRRIAAPLVVAACLGFSML